MINYEMLFNTEEYSLDRRERETLLLSGLSQLTKQHRHGCAAYDKLISILWKDWEINTPTPSLAELPYLPVSIFKSNELKSVTDEEIYKALHSSGTTSERPSRIYLDRATAQRQSKALTHIATHWLGKSRLPLLIIDSDLLLRDRDKLSARAAGIAGFMTFGRDYCFALDEHMNLKREVVKEWVESHRGYPIMIFGFTFMIWKYLYERCQEKSLDLSHATLVHGGGWKKLLASEVSKESFKSNLKQTFGISRVHDFYGMVEQVGSIFFECEAGYFHAPHFSEVIIRDPRNWRETPLGTEGVIQVLSLLPTSYPGHSLLTEDRGTLVGRDLCRCGRKGTHFTVAGRIANVELRGCSDTHAFTQGEKE